MRTNVYITKELLIIVLISLLWVIPGCSAQETGTVKDSRDGKTYNTVKIGDQWWLAENLAYLPEVRPSSEPEFVFPQPEEVSTDKYYYVYDYQGTNVSEAKATDMYIARGVLYNFEAAQTACMAGWHLPSDEEWKTLEKYLGMNSSESDEGGKENSNNFRNSGEVGKKLKSISGWAEDGNGNNSSGFNALPGGSRLYYGEGFGRGEKDAIFWSSTKNESPDTWKPFAAWFRMLVSEHDGVWRSNTNPNGGYSIRCVKD